MLSVLADDDDEGWSGEVSRKFVSGCRATY